jgi:hypothetical protein
MNEQHSRMSTGAMDDVLDPETGGLVKRWTVAHRYSAKERALLSQLGHDDSDDPRFTALNREIVRICETPFSKGARELSLDFLYEDLMLSPDLKKAFVEPLEEDDGTLSSSDEIGFPEWVKKYPQSCWLLLKMHGVDDIQWEGADRFNRALIRACLNPQVRHYDNFEAGRQMLLDYLHMQDSVGLLPTRK